MGPVYNISVYVYDLVNKRSSNRQIFIYTRRILTQYIYTHSICLE